MGGNQHPVSDAASLVDEVLGREPEVLFVLNRGFEDRCTYTADLLAQRSVDRSRVSILCIEYPEDNLPPLAIRQQRRLKERLKSIGPDFLNERDADVRIREWLSRQEREATIVLDASSMPRRVLFGVLAAAAEARPKLIGVKLLYTHPATYVEGLREEPSPFVQTLYPSPRPKDMRVGCLCLFPSFDPADSSLAISHLLGGSGEHDGVSIELCFAFPGPEYRFPERAREAHMALLNHAERPPAVRLVHAGGVDDISARLVEVADGLAHDESLFVAVLGPRILCAPVFLTVQALRQRNIRANILLTRPLVYRSIRSSGHGRTEGWDLSAALARVKDALVRGLTGETLAVVHQRRETTGTAR